MPHSYGPFFAFLEHLLPDIQETKFEKLILYFSDTDSPSVYFSEPPWWEVWMEVGLS